MGSSRYTMSNIILTHNIITIIIIIAVVVYSRPDGRLLYEVYNYNNNLTLLRYLIFKSVTTAYYSIVITILIL